MYKGNLRDSPCPAPGYTKHCRNLKSHVIGTHLCNIFGDHSSRELLADPGFTNKRKDAVIQLARWILKRQNATSYQLMRYVDKKVRFSWDSSVGVRSYPAMRKTCSAFRSLPDTFTINPLNILVCLLYWRVKVSLLRKISHPEQREAVNTWGYDKTLIPAGAEEEREENNAGLEMDPPVIVRPVEEPVV